MKADGMNNSHPVRLHELESQFKMLETEIKEPAVKNAISVLHGMLQETWRNLNVSSIPGQVMGPTLNDIANLYKQAPKMEGTALNKPLTAGTAAPDFTLPDQLGRDISLRDYRGKKVLLVFYPLDWSPGCSQQLDLYEAELQEFKKRGVELVAISVDSIYSHGAWAAVRGISFPLLSDFNPKGEIAKKYQVYRESSGYSERALYLVDEEGVIEYSYVSPFIHHVPDIYQLYAEIDRREELQRSVQ